MAIRLYPDKWQPKEFPPDDLHPTVRFGYVLGGNVRIESQGVERKDAYVFIGSFLKNVEPLVQFSVSNLQKQSLFGFLLFKPFLFRIWFMPKKQLKCAHGGWVPNSELGIDIRLPGWRKDYAGHKGRFWDWTFGRIGFHWD